MAGYDVVCDHPSLLRVRLQKVDVPLDGASREGRRNKLPLCNEIRCAASKKNRYALTRAGRIARDGQGDHVSVIGQSGFRIARINGENGTNIAPPRAPAPGMKPRRQTATCQTLQRRIAFDPPVCGPRGRNPGFRPFLRPKPKPGAAAGNFVAEHQRFNKPRNQAFPRR